MRSRLIVINTFVLPYSSINAQTKHCRKVRNKFRPRKATLTVQVRGEYHRYSCTDRLITFNTGVKKRKIRPAK